MSGTTPTQTFPRLGPAWRGGAQGGGKGFQPPPAVPAAGGRDRSNSAISSGSGGKRDSNSFAALDDFDDDAVVGTGSASNGPDATKSRTFSSRSEALRGPSGAVSPGYPRNSAGATKQSGGRSLADLAASRPVTARTPERSAAPPASVKIIRFTRERLLSMRPQPDPSADLPTALKNLEGSAIVSKTPQDPVCWDTFDPDEIWGQPVRERRVGLAGAAVATKGPVSDGPSLRAISESSARMRTEIDRDEPKRVGGGGGRWQRGVALPPTEETPARGGRGNLGRGRDEEAEDPDELWDDPVGGHTGAAADFSQFGIMPSESRSRGSSFGSGGFDLGEMSEAAKKFEEELHGKPSGPSGSLENDDKDPGSPSARIDSSRPLASVGTTIRSGSGDDVNVFEDFGAPGTDEEEKANAEVSASSRLMQMIGVKPDESNSGEAGLGAAPNNVISAWDDAAAEPTAASSSVIPLNPWGDTALPSGAQNQGMDLSAQLEAARAEQKAREAEQRRSEEEEMLRRRRQEEEEEAKRRAAAQAQQEAATKAQQESQTHQQGSGGPGPGGHSQVELILMERISTFLEAQWGRSDLMSILSALHAEDSRVIPLLGNSNALRALIARHPRRVSLTKDPAFGAEMAVLVTSNAQWQQQQQQQQQVSQAQRQEELQRQQVLQQQQQMQAAQQAAAARAQAEAEERAKAEAAQNKEGGKPVITDAPWFYADPQRNIQGPFRGEEMRQWFDAGYFKGDLPISQNPKGPFHLLSSLFPDPVVAFKPTPEEKEDESAKLALAQQRAQEEAAAAEQARAEAEEKERIAADLRRKEKAAAEAAEKEAQAQARAAAAAAAAEQNAQLKMMLGLSAGAQEKPDSQGGLNIAGPPKVIVTQKRTPASPSTNEQSPSNQQAQSAQNSKQNRPQPRAPQPASAPPAPAAASPASAARPPAPAWGGTAVAGKASGRKKSIAEIQLEEARVRARRAKENAGRSPGGGGWANIAASGGGSTAWSSGELKQTPAMVVPVAAALTAPRPGVAPKPVAASMQQVRAKQQAQVSAGQKQALVQQQRAKKSVDNFGENSQMSPALESWCKEQMRKLNGSDDLTLVTFCMTLTDPIEIRQYLTAYLGSTPQVNNFATDFISRKGGGKGKQEEWESAGGTKKGKKKKATK